MVSNRSLTAGEETGSSDDLAATNREIELTGLSGYLSRENIKFSRSHSSEKTIICRQLFAGHVVSSRQ